MSITLPTLTPIEESLWLTLSARAVDNRSPRPILGDAAADEIVRTLNYDYSKLKMDTNLKLSVALRAKKLDQVTADFLARHPNAIGLDLGSGLDTRLNRLGDPAGVEWYDVDLPAVTAFRKQLIPLPSQGHVIAADVRDTGWLDAVPNDRPVIIVADGLMGFLNEEEMVTLWNRIVDHFPSGELVFNAYTRFSVWVATHALGAKSVAKMIRFPGMDDARAAESWHPKLKLVKEIVLSREPEVADFPANWRLFHRLISHSTTLSRMASFVLHYRF
ncbi:class I SAM-dependent methyltransferase [Paractinoplanes rishiriensis]|uniref:O-methyltransferase n=1 Tax=Paractinoplanes rishiriensis TaxID=1050105 RepID=A0A919N239_9ACTN|nr:class I SAM-dependent methyltransferase [Actinoplanes rishiriensis]GIE98542.1 putative O-methyltransferase [Actinoplanes rishiriensis]